MGFAAAIEIATKWETCCNCGLVFGVPADWQAGRRRDGRTFYCPNGHGQSYTESEADKLRKELEAQKRATDFERSRAMSLDRRLKQEAGKHKALRRRVAAGVCPCCQRTVKQLAAHMKAKHPDYQAAQEPPAQGTETTA